ncbi:MAG TPA: RsmE family RNA methyltransferase [Acidobacteriaceae bacterium]
MTRRRWIANHCTESTATLTGSQAEHLARVLRAQPGAEADVVANNHVYRATIASVQPDAVEFTLHEEIAFDRALPITLVMAIFKFDRMEWAIEKVTELGVSTVVPVLARRTEKHLGQSAAKRVERWRRIAQEGAQQSRRSDIPRIEDPLTLPTWLQREPSAARILLSEEEREHSLRRRLEAIANSTHSDLPSIACAIGPEGGWTNDELILFQKHEWQSASLGSRILRAETAAIAAITLTSAFIADL